MATISQQVCFLDNSFTKQSLQETESSDTIKLFSTQRISTAYSIMLNGCYSGRHRLDFFDGQSLVCSSSHHNHRGRHQILIFRDVIIFLQICTYSNCFIDYFISLLFHQCRHLMFGNNYSLDATEYRVHKNTTFALIELLHCCIVH